jgi:hypothetical protein
MATFANLRTIEKLVDDEGKVTHVKCSQCCWKVPVNEKDSDETVRKEYKSFCEHNCDDHRIGAAFRK